MVEVTVPPFATVTLEGWKLRDGTVPTPFGIETPMLEGALFDELESEKTLGPPVRWLAFNRGLDPIDTITQLRKEHAQNRFRMGVGDQGSVRICRQPASSSLRR